MKKKPQRYSFKKLTAFSKKQEIKLFNQPKISFDRQNKSQTKHKSSERIINAYQTSARFKVNKNNGERTRFRTQNDQTHQQKSPYQKIMTQARQSRQLWYNKSKNNQKHKSNLLQTKQINIKKLNLAAEIAEIAKNSSLQRSNTPHSSKNYSFRKAHQSYRSGIKKTALQKYVSESLQNLQLGNKKRFNSTARHEKQDLNTTIKKALIQQSSKYQKNNSHRQETPKVRQERDRDSSKKLQTQKDESLQKIQLKWQKKKHKIPYDLSKQQNQLFGDRFPDGFTKLKLLGRGGFSLVWLGQHNKSKKKYAIKQILTQSSHQTHIKQIWFGSYFFQLGGGPKQNFIQHRGIKHLVKLFYYFINKKDTWILYQKCGDSLGNALYQLKSQQYNGQKIYRINYKDFYTRVRLDQNQLRRLVLNIAKSLQLLSQNNIVHSDLKTQNILVRLKGDQQNNNQSNKRNYQDKQSWILQTKLIDYGSSFVFSNLRQFSMATPQYMAPQILNFILYQNQFQYIPKLLQYVQKYSNSWVIDVWSLGSVLLEIVSGVPLWMSLKTLVKKKDKDLIRYGLFAIKGRAFDKIIKQQLEVVQNLQHFLYQQNYSGIVLEQDLKILLKKMLALNPSKRISPTQIIQYLERSLKEQ